MKDAFSTATLNDGLPSNNGNAAKVEKELLTHFKASALSIATLYKSALATSKQSYSSGYQACLVDLQTFLHAGVSIQGQGESSAGKEGLTIGRVMDWVEARLEALREEEEDDDEDKDKDRESGAALGTRNHRQAPVAQTNVTASTSRASQASEHRMKTDVERSDHQPERVRASSQNSSPSPRSLSPPLHKPNTHRKDRSSIVRPLQQHPFQFVSPADSTVEFPVFTGTGGAPDGPLAPLSISPVHIPSEAPINVGIGSKRRHGSLIDSSAPSASRGAPSVPSGSRRRARNSRVSSTPHTNVPPGRENPSATSTTGNPSASFEPMEVEERPRKTARR